MKLSILVCSLEKRAHFLERLLNYFSVQTSGLEDQVQVLVNQDNGEKSIGKKRNELLERAKGEYVAFFDDDDLPGPTYVESILKAIEQKPDVVGVSMIMTTNGFKAEKSFHSLQFKEWFDIEDKLEKGKRTYFRCPHHLCPVKIELARQVGYPEISMGEDKDYSYRLLPLLKTEVFIDIPIYFYLFVQNK